MEEKDKFKFLDYYDTIKQLGNGGNGKVYEVKNKKTGQFYACKIISKFSIKNLEKFKKEINILKNLDHPNIIKIYKIHETQRSFYIVMEECKGGRLLDRIIEHIQSNQMYSERDAAEILQQVMSIIEYCHNNENGYIGLKPENVLYLNNGPEKGNPIKVIDFGLSQINSQEINLKKKLDSEIYVAPEIHIGTYTEKSDIWSAGVILYLLLSGALPFKSSIDSDIYDEIAQMNFTFPEQKWKDISNDAKDLIKHMIAPEKERYNSKQVLSHPWFKNLSALNLNNNNIFNNSKESNIRKQSLIIFVSRLEENEIENLKKTFETSDKFKDGQISFEELKKGLLQLKSSNLNENEIIQFFKSIDVNQNERINYTEFLTVILQKINYFRNERLFKTLCLLDKDNSGYITKEELIQALKAVKIQEKEIEKYIMVVDKNGDGKIDYKEFLDIIKAHN